MRNSIRRVPAARQSGGFTLVELLVVIGIIAILAGVALGPITNGIKKAQESAAMQSTRSIALAEFQYSNDNSSYPDGNDAGVIGTQLITGSYISDPNIFKISADAQWVAEANAGAFTNKNCSYDFMGVQTNNGLPSTTPDQVPVVWSAGDPGCTVPAGNAGVAFTPTNGIFAKDGVAVAYHSNNAFFRAPNHNPNVAYPPNGEAIFVDNTYDFTGSTISYQIKKGDQ